MEVHPKSHKTDLLSLCKSTRSCSQHMTSKPPTRMCDTVHIHHSGESFLQWATPSYSENKPLHSGNEE